MQATIIITGEPSWLARIQAQLGDTYHILHQPDAKGYMNALIENLAALVLVDGDAPDWATWVSTPKVSPATRRIPIVVVSDNDDMRAAITNAGGDHMLTSAELLADAPRLVADIARIPDPERMEQLACDCQEPLPPRAREGVAKFNAGEYYAQHDLFEEQWVETDAPVRDLYRAVLQVGVAYYQIQRGNYRGALKMLQRSVQWLVILPDSCQGINVKRLREDSFKVRAELERLGEDRFDEFDMSLIRGVDYTPVA